MSFLKYAFVAAATLISLTSYAQSTENPEVVRVCRYLSHIPHPQNITPDQCYDQAKNYLLQNNIKIMTGSYEAYFALSEDDPSQKVCRTFLVNVVRSTQRLELSDARAIYGDDRAQSLDRAYYSYQLCEERAEAMRMFEPAPTHHRRSSATKTNAGVQ